MSSERTFEKRALILAHSEFVRRNSDGEMVGMDGSVVKRYDITAPAFLSVSLFGGNIAAYLLLGYVRSEPRFSEWQTEGVFCRTPTLCVLIFHF